MVHLIKNRVDLIQSSRISSQKESRKLLLDLYEAALISVDPYNIILDRISFDRRTNELIIDSDRYSLESRDIWIIGAGKAVARMAEALEIILDNNMKGKGLIITPIGTKQVISLQNITILEGTHPFPSDQNIENTAELISFLKSIPTNDLVIALISGGGSALLAAPYPPITASELSTLNRVLIAKSNMPIRDLNCVRKLISQIKGGKLLHSISAEIIVLALSDVVGDDLSSIASGPFYPELVNPADVIKTLKVHELWNKAILPASIFDFIETKFALVSREEDEIPPNPPPHYLLGTNKIACYSVMHQAKILKINSLFLTNRLEGDSRELGILLARIYRGIAESWDLTFPLIVVSGGETTIEVQGDGIGGRNQELAAALLQELESWDFQYSFLSCGTDGIDGNSTFAGVLVDNTSLHEVHATKKLNLTYYQENNDVTTFFKLLGGSLIDTGITGTNVCDIQIMKIDGRTGML